jgi:hypothetical protein
MRCRQSLVVAGGCCCCCHRCCQLLVLFPIPAVSPGLDGLVRIVKRKLKKIQYRPRLVDGCLAATGLILEPW